MSIAEWVRQALELVRRKQPLGSVAKKIEAIHAAGQYAFPTADIDRMLAEIERG